MTRTTIAAIAAAAAFAAPAAFAEQNATGSADLEGGKGIEIEQNAGLPEEGAPVAPAEGIQAADEPASRVDGVTGAAGDTVSAETDGTTDVEVGSDEGIQAADEPAAEVEGVTGAPQEG